MCNSYFWFYLPLRPDDLFHRPMQLQQSFIIYLKEILVWLVIQKSHFYEEKSIFPQIAVDLFVTLGRSDEKSHSDSCVYFSIISLSD